PAIVVKVIRHGGNRIARARLENPRFFGNVAKRPVSIVVIEDVRSRGEPAGTAHDRHALVLAIHGLTRCGYLGDIQHDVVGHKKIEESVAIVVEPGAAGPPADFILPKPRLLGHIGEGAVAVVAEQNVVPPKRAKQVVPAIVIEIAHADASLPAGAAEAGFGCDVSERSVAVVVIKLGGGRMAWRPFCVQASSVGEINVQPAILIVIEERDAAAFGLNDVILVVY